MRLRLRTDFGRFLYRQSSSSVPARRISVTKLTIPRLPKVRGSESLLSALLPRGGRQQAANWQRAMKLRRLTITFTRVPHRVERPATHGQLILRLPTRSDRQTTSSLTAWTSSQLRGSHARGERVASSGLWRSLDAARAAREQRSSARVCQPHLPLLAPAADSAKRGRRCLGWARRATAKSVSATLDL